MSVSLNLDLITTSPPKTLNATAYYFSSPRSSEGDLLPNKLLPPLEPKEAPHDMAMVTQMMPSIREPLRPASRGVVFSPRPSSNQGLNQRPLRNNVPVASLRTRPASPASSVTTTLNPKLSPIEIENIMRQKVCAKAGVLKRAFQVYDTERTMTVTLGEFRRVLEYHCMPMTSQQFKSFLAKVAVNGNGTISYTKFLEQFILLSHHFSHSRVPVPSKLRTTTVGNIFPVSRQSRDRPASAKARSAPSGQHAQMKDNLKANRTNSPEFNPNFHRYTCAKAPQDMGIDAIEKALQKKITSNLRNVVKALQLFDYNRDGLIQRHELRRVLDNYCFKMSEEQFKKFWFRYDFHHVGTINYREFLRRLGVNAAAADAQLRTMMDEDDAAPWNAKKKKLEREKAVTDLVLRRDRSKLNDTGDTVKKLTYHQVEKEFRKKMKANHEDIKRAMMSFDACMDGFITIDDLKAVLDNFVIPMSEDVFHQLMYRFEVRGTGKVSWEQFLEKFQDPQGDGNGQTIPIGRNHKVNPIRESLDTASTADIIKKLYSHVLENHGSLKEAFLKFDKNRKGRVSRNDLRSIIESFTIKLDDNSFKQFMVALDPENTGLIDYHKFLELFEAKEHVGAHKWLFSTHKVNTNQPPAIMAWTTVENIMREKISENWREFASEYAALDIEGDGSITRHNLRRLIERYSLPVSDQHFDKLWNCCTCTDNRVMLAQFLNNLGVDVQPGDIFGMSTRICNESNTREKVRNDDQENRLNEINMVGTRHTTNLRADDVIVKLKDHMRQHDNGIRKSFLRYSRSGKGFVTKRDFKQMLNDIGLWMLDEQFEELTKVLGFRGKGLQYSDFIASFQDKQSLGVGQELERAENHVVYPTNVKYMTAEECNQQLQERMRQNFGSVRSAFYKVDDDHDGILTTTELRRLLDSFMFIITDETFEELLRLWGLQRKSRLTYRDFLQKFEMTDSAEGHPWLKSQHRFNRPREANELAADQVHSYLCTKAEQSWSDVARAFQSFDTDGNGIIKKKELRSVLFRFILPINAQEFKKLWERYDSDGKGYITHQEFLQKLGKGLTPGDDLGMQGTSRKMVEENYANMLAHHDHQQNKHEEIANNQIQYSRNLSAETVERELKDRFREYFQDFDKAFRKMDSNKDGYVTLEDLQRVLTSLNYFLDDHQFLELLQRLGLDQSKSRLSYFDFLQAIDDGRSSRYNKRSKKQPQPLRQSFNLLPVEKAIQKIKNKITTNYEGICSAFRAFDRSQSGLIKVSEFRRLLDNFCFCLTDRQFTEVLTKCRIVQPTTINPNKMINWIVFMQEFSLIKDPRNQAYVDHLDTVVPPSSPCEITLEEIEDRISEVIRARHSSINNAFLEADYAKINVISKDDFKGIFNQHFMRLTDDQIDRLWVQQAVNEFNNLDYREFMKRYSMAADEVKEEKNDDKEEQEIAMNLKLNEETYNKSKTSKQIHSELNEQQSPRRQELSPVKMSENYQKQLQSLVFKRWQDIQKDCRKLDVKGKGSIPGDEFITILDRMGLILPLNEAKDLIRKYESRPHSGYFDYKTFLKHYILTLKPREEGLLRRKKLHQTKLKFQTGTENDKFVRTLMALRDSVLQCWKEMRRTFRSYDTRGDGFVSSALFKEVLEQYSIFLSPEEYFHLMSYYDYNLQDRIPYNDFIRVFLQ